MFSQQIKGTILDENKQPLPGVNVSNTTAVSNAVSDIDGNFIIKANIGEILNFEYLGFKTLTISAQQNMQVNMQPSVTDLSEVVVVGYGTQRKADITGSITIVSAKELENRPNSSAISSLQGKVAGVNITNTGSPGGQPNISIRGIGSISGNDILYVVDGVLTNNIAYLNPNDIERMSILKDASSLAIYGIRASSGVIIVTTKTGSVSADEKINFNYDSNVGFQTPTNVPQYANAADYVKLYNEKLKYDNITDPTKVLSLSQFNGVDTNWMNEVLRQTSISNSHNIGMTGNTKKAKYAMGIGYFTQDGIINAGKGVSSGEDFKRITARMNGTYDVSDKFRIGGSFAYVKSNSNDAIQPFQLARITPSVIPVYNLDGTYGTVPAGSGLGSAGDINPRFNLDLFRGKSNITRTLLSGFAEYNIFKSLVYKINVSRDFETVARYTYNPEYKSIPNQTPFNSRLTKINETNDNLLTENTLTWKKDYGKHRLVLLAGASRESRKVRNSSFSILNVPFKGSDETLYLNLGTQSTLVDLLQSPGSQGNEIRYQSYFGRLQYAFDDKYLLNATIRRDGTSTYNFDGNQKTATFPSVGIGWVVSKEKFMQNSGIDFLKFKASWGQLGNATIPRQFDLVASNQPPGFFGNPSQLNTAISITQLIDPEIDWEVVTGTDFGLEMKVFKNRLSIETGYYKKETKNGVFSISNIPTSGLGGNLFTNAGSFENKGFEFSATWNDKIGEKFSYSFYGNFTTIDNKITEVLGNAFFNTGPALFNESIKRYEVGQEIGAYYGFQTNGVIQTQAEATALNSKVGAFKFKDLDGNGIIDNKDKTFLGSPIPNLTYGFGLNITYAAVDFAAEFQGVSGNEIYNFNRNARFGNENWDQDFVDNRWTPQNQSNTYPAPNSDQNSSKPSSFYVEKGDYFRIRTLQLGYSMTNNLLDRLKMDKLRFYVGAQNPFTSFKYNGFSPELGSQRIENLGIDDSAYPLTSIYSFGINLNF